MNLEVIQFLSIVISKKVMVHVPNLLCFPSWVRFSEVRLHRKWGFRGSQACPQGFLSRSRPRLYISPRSLPRPANSRSSFRSDVIPVAYRLERGPQLPVLTPHGQLIKPRRERWELVGNTMGRSARCDESRWRMAWLWIGK